MTTWDEEVARHRERFLRSYEEHELRKIGGVGSHPDDRWSTWLLRRPDTMMFSTVITCAGNQVILSGDAHPGKHALGSIPLGDAPLRWFSARLSPDYLAGKFLDRYSYAPHVVAWLNERIVEYVAEGAEEDAALFRELRDSVHRLGVGWSRHLEDGWGYDDVLEDLHNATGGGGVPSCYDPSEYAHLIVIQQRFRELYGARDPSPRISDDEWGRAREAAGVPPFDPAVVIGWLQRAGERIDTEFTARPGYRDSEGTAPTACELQDAEWTLRGLFGVWNEPEEDPCD